METQQDTKNSTRESLTSCGYSPITPCGATRSDQTLRSSNLTLTRDAWPSLSRGSSRRRSTLLKNSIWGDAPAATASQIRRFPSSSTLPSCSRNALERAMLAIFLKNRRQEFHSWNNKYWAIYVDLQLLLRLVSFSTVWPVSPVTAFRRWQLNG